MVEADIHFRPLHTSILDIYKVFETLVYCLKGIWVHPYLVTLARLAPDLGSQGHLWSENDAIMSWADIHEPLIVIVSCECPHSSSTSEGQNFDLAKYIVSGTRYEYSIQFIVLYNTVHCFYQEFQYFIRSSLYCHYEAVYFIKQFTTVLKCPIIFLL
jgi:hypothetical protein